MRWHYFLHLVVWAGPLILLQWVIGWRVFWRNLRAVFIPPLIAVLFFGACDSVAIKAGIWFFDPRQTLGWGVGGLPLEEMLFFLLTSLLVTQSLLLLLPARHRWS